MSYPLPRALHQATIKVMVVSLLAATLAGLLPPPVMRTVLPSPAAQMVEALLPAAAPAQAAPLAQLMGSTVLTITKNVVGSSNVGPYNITVSGPGGYSNNTTVSVGAPRVLTGLVSGVYTVTESSPGVGWTTTYTATPGTGGSSNAVVNLAGPAVVRTTAGNITGKVYQDYNSNGFLDTSGAAPNFAIDTGVAGVTVTAYDVNGAVVGTPQTTNATGDYTINPGGVQGPYRVEFSNLPSGYAPTTHGTGNGTSTQFVTTNGGATNVDFGISAPGDYCQNNPELCTVELSKADATVPALLLTPYDGSGALTTPSGALNTDVGALWGIAYQKVSRQIFTSSYVRRFAKLYEDPADVQHVGQIFLTDAARTAMTPYVDVAALGVDVGPVPTNTIRALSAPSDVHMDAAVAPLVGKRGIGDMEMSADGTHLYFMNLYDRRLYAINVGVPAKAGSSLTAADVSVFNLPPTNCPNGVFRPFALAVKNGKVYAGGTCTGENGGTLADLSIAVYVKPDGAGAFSPTPALQAPFNYVHGCAYSPFPYTCGWNVWFEPDWATVADIFDANGWHQQPFLTDIELTTDGSMVLGVADRNSNQTFAILAGDILRACSADGVTWTLESAGKCVIGGTTYFGPSGAATNGQGPGGGEFFSPENAVPEHSESAQGGLGYLPGAPDVVTTMLDPIYEFYSNGVAFMSLSTGARSSVIKLRSNTDLGKAQTLGDTEVLCDSAPLEIGNRVWNDGNGNGVQDPGEPGLANVTVSLQSPTHTVTTNTDANGLYYFSVSPQTAYTLTIQPPTGYQVTRANAAAVNGLSTTTNDAILDTRDSDAVLVGGAATIYYTTGSAGQNNHGLDFGFAQSASGQVTIINTAPPPPPASLGNLVWKDTNSNGLQDPGEPGIPGVTVELYDSSGNAAQCPQSSTANLALNQAATLSSLFAAGYEATNAVDGNTASGMSITDNTANAWWQVDLGQSAALRQVVIYPRPDGNHDQTEQIYIEVSNQPFASTTLATTLADPNVWHSTLQGAWTGTSLTIAVPNYLGRYVRIQHSNTYYLSLGEVQVFGDPLAPVTTVTDANGIYTFAAAQCVQSSTSYQVQIDTTQSALQGLSLTVQNAGGNTSNDATTDDADSDAALVGNLAVINPATTPAAGANNSYDFGFVTAAIQIVKRITGGTVTAPFNVSVSGPNGYLTTTTVFAGAPITLTGLNGGNYTVAEVAPLPAAPTGLAWQSPTYAPAGGQVVAVAGATAVVTLTNVLGPAPAGSGVLTVTKTISGTGTGPFNITITGPTGVVSTTTINGGQSKVFTGLASGIYTVTEATPTGWTAVYSATASAGAASGGSSHAVVTLQKSNSPTPTTAGVISGKVYHDFNSNGQLDTSSLVIDDGLAGVTVTAYDPNGAAVGTATTDANGAYSFTPSKPGPYRLEMSNAPAGYYPTAHGTGNGTSTQFVTTAGGASNINFGLNVPGDYCQSTPNLLTPIFCSGNPADASAFGIDSVLSTPYGSTTTSSSAAQVQQTGSLYGVAADKARRRALLSAYVRRHAGLYESPIGTPKPGEIFTILYGGTSATPFVDLASIGVNVGTVPSNILRGLGDTSVPSTDAGANGVYEEVGTVGIGDIDIDANGDLWVVSLYDRQLYQIHLPTDGSAPTATDVSAKGVIVAPCATGSGVARPFGLQPHDGSIYLGVVCDASIDPGPNRANLDAYVMRFDPATNLYSPFFGPIELNYAKGCAVGGVPESCQWYHWDNNWVAGNTAYGAGAVHPIPMLSDIEFDMTGSMILEFRDRFGDQNGLYTPRADGSGSFVGDSGGDILRVCRTGTGYSSADYTMQGQPGCANTIANSEGPGGGEYYAADNLGGTTHAETAQGSSAYVPGYLTVATTTMDPVTFGTGGLRYFTNSTGAQAAVIELAHAVVPRMGKSNGLGDIEALCDMAPLEIGNRVWNDVNGNGVQDPGEPGLANVTVSLQSAGSTVMTDTDANGLYYFSVSPQTAYTLTIQPPTGYQATLANAAAVDGVSMTTNDAINDTRDSDAVLVGGKATIYYTTGLAGQNNHGLDFGFTQPVTGRVQIVNTAPLLPSYTLRKQLITIDPVRVGEAISFTMRITNTGGVLISSLPLSDSYDTRYLQYVSAIPAPDDNNDDGQLNWSDVTSAGTLAPGAHLDVSVNFVAFHDTTLLPGGATINTASSGAQTSSASVRINAPTAVEIADKVVQVVDGQVVVQWSTVSETPLVGFYLWREDGSGQVVRLTSDLILAQKAGQSSGAAYRYTDPTATLGAYYRYVLELLDTDGLSSYSEVGRVGGRINLYLPAVRR